MEMDDDCIGLVCCGDYSAGHFASYRALADTDVDMVIHLGDYVYADPEGDVRPVEPERDAVTRADYRRRYQQVRRDPDLQALHLRHPMITVIDDHDLADNATSTGAKGHDPDTQGEWADRLEAATSERLVWLPIRAKGPSGRRAPAQWRSVELGTLGPLVLTNILWFRALHGIARANSPVGASGAVLLDDRGGDLLLRHGDMTCGTALAYPVSVRENPYF